MWIVFWGDDKRSHIEKIAYIEWNAVSKICSTDFWILIETVSELIRITYRTAHPADSPVTSLPTRNEKHQPLVLLTIIFMPIIIRLKHLCYTTLEDNIVYRNNNCLKYEYLPRDPNSLNIVICYLQTIIIFLWDI